MEVRETVIPGLLVIAPKRHGDARGFFSESWNQNAMETAGIHVAFVQDNMSLSAEPGTLRGLHYQAPPHAQTKLVSCLQGRMFDAVVDVRRGSPTFGQSLGLELSFENGLQLLVPKGLLHGFVTLEPDTVVFYKVDQYYSREADGAVHWDSCGIEWPVSGVLKISDKDTKAIPYHAFESPFVWEDA